MFHPPLTAIAIQAVDIALPLCQAGANGCVSLVHTLPIVVIIVLRLHHGGRQCCSGPCPADGRLSCMKDVVYVAVVKHAEAHGAGGCASLLLSLTVLVPLVLMCLRHSLPVSDLLCIQEIV